jgi:hypothetical protein
MRSEKGLKKLTENYSGKLSVDILASLLLADLKVVTCFIFGNAENEEAVLLSKLKTAPDSLYYEAVEKRIDFMVTGQIMANQHTPLTYQVQGDKYCFHGRCSTIPRVCGVDLYLSRSYTEKVGDIVWQRFSIEVKELFKQVYHV